MTRERAKELQKNHGMEIMRDEITREGFGLCIVAENRIPELDTLARDSATAMVADYSGEPICVMYRLYCPESWFDLWGWADE